MMLGTIFYNDFELLDAYGPMEMFRALGDKMELVNVAEQAGPVKSSAGPKTIADFSFANAPELDLILLPGGIGTIAELKNTALLNFLKQRCPKTQLTMSVCTGSALLAKAGLLTTGWSFSDNKQDVFRTCPKPRRKRLLAGNCSLGGRRAIRHFFWCIRRYGYGLSSNRTFVRHRIGGNGDELHRISMASGRERRPLCWAAQPRRSAGIKAPVRR